jgi:phage host-nuclease inhibitor protein Gam
MQMAAKSTGRTAFPAHKVTPQTAAEAADLMGDLGGTMAELAGLQADCDAAVNKVASAYQPKIQVLAERKKAIELALQTWAEANKDDLTSDGKRTVNLGTGEVGWRICPPAVKVTGVAKVIEVLKAKALDRFIKVKEDLDKKAILEEPAAVKGVKGLEIVQNEIFWVKPAGLDMEEIAS